MQNIRMTVDQIILDLIEAEPVTDQATLLALLDARGYRLTQPTLSRHLKKLSVIKQNGRYQRVERATPDRPPFTLTIAPPNLLVLKTAPGHAPLLGVLVDRIGLDAVAGTLAGDDTVFIALAEGSDPVATAAHIEQALDA